MFSAERGLNSRTGFPLRMKSYSAPWSTTLKVVTLLATLVCVGVAVLLARHGGLGATITSWGLSLLIFGSMLFTVRGYVVTPDAILVRRLLWSTRLALNELTSVQEDPKAMTGSLRTFGNGGLFSFTGLFFNRRLGHYQAFVMDPSRAVVLQYPRRTVVLSPEPPAAFVAEVEAAINSR